MRIAVVSTGLGRVRRGIETWAASLHAGLLERSADAVLFGGRTPAGPRERTIRGLPRDSKPNRIITGCLRSLGGWRYGFGSRYQTEQTAFYPGLMRYLKRGGFDIVHLQDPWLAWLLERANRRGRLRARVIFAHGTEEPAEFRREFRHIQELSPFYLAQLGKAAPAEGTRHAIPNFVDCRRFCRAEPEEREELRRNLGIPEGKRVVLSVGAINRARKRFDRLFSEFAAANAPDAMLVTAGHCDREGEELVKEGRGMLGDRYLHLRDLGCDQMPSLYKAADLFVLCSTAEIFGIAFIEAMACGIPCIGHRYAVTEWIIGGGGACVDMTKEGELASFMEGIDATWLGEKGRAARERALAAFSSDVVIEQIIGMYREAMGN